MGYPTDSIDTPLQFLRLGGLNERFSPHALPAPDFSVLHGLYPDREGRLARLPGIEALAVAGLGDAAIWAIYQPNDGTDNIIVQTSDGTERTFTLNELFGRTVTSSLTYTPLQDDENMPTAIILEDAANGVDGTAIASSNTWTIRPLTSNPLNESTIIVAFSTVSDTFELAPGTYRIRGFVSGSVSIDMDSAGVETDVCGFQAALVNTTDSTTISTGSPATHSVIRSSGTSEYTWGPVTLHSLFDDTFTVSGGNKTFSIYNAFLQTGTDAAFTRLTGKASSVSAALNGAAVRQPYMKLAISKVA